jgi:hypothetical protein
MRRHASRSMGSSRRSSSTSFAGSRASMYARCSSQNGREAWRERRRNQWESEGEKQSLDIWKEARKCVDVNWMKSMHAAKLQLQVQRRNVSQVLLRAETEA